MRWLTYVVNLLKMCDVKNMDFNSIDYPVIKLSLEH